MLTTISSNLLKKNLVGFIALYNIIVVPFFRKAQKKFFGLTKVILPSLNKKLVIRGKICAKVLKIFLLLTLISSIQV